MTDQLETITNYASLKPVNIDGLKMTPENYTLGEKHSLCDDNNITLAFTNETLQVVNDPGRAYGAMNDIKLYDIRTYEYDGKNVVHFNSELGSINYSLGYYEADKKFKAFVDILGSSITENKLDDLYGKNRKYKKVCDTAEEAIRFIDNKISGFLDNIRKNAEAEPILESPFEALRIKDAVLTAKDGSIKVEIDGEELLGGGTIRGNTATWGFYATYWKDSMVGRFYNRITLEDNTIYYTIENMWAEKDSKNYVVYEGVIHTDNADNRICALHKLLSTTKTIGIQLAEEA